MIEGDGSEQVRQRDSKPDSHVPQRLFREKPVSIMECVEQREQWRWFLTPFVY